MKKMVKRILFKFLRFFEFFALSDAVTNSRYGSLQYCLDCLQYKSLRKILKRKFIFETSYFWKIIHHRTQLQSLAITTCNKILMFSQIHFSKKKNPKNGIFFFKLTLFFGIICSIGFNCSHSQLQHALLSLLVSEHSSNSLMKQKNLLKQILFKFEV